MLYGVTYEFLWQPFSHNIVWREPRPAYDDVGNPLTTGAPLYDPVFVDGIAGTAGWDWTTPRIYKPADFNPMLGLRARGCRRISDEDGVGGEYRGA